MFTYPTNVARAVGFAIFCFGCFLFSFTLPALAWTGKVVATPAGDTITVLQAGRQEITVSLYGVKTPGRDQPYSPEARRFTSDMTTGKIVDVGEVSRDQLSRPVAIITIAGRCLNEELIRAGWAWVYRYHGDKTPPRPDWLKMEKTARENKIGLWQDKNPMPPWRWRKLQDSTSRIKKQKLEQKDQ